MTQLLKFTDKTKRWSIDDRDLSLRIDHQRPSTSKCHNQSILNAQSVCGKALSRIQLCMWEANSVQHHAFSLMNTEQTDLNIPLPDFSRLSKNSFKSERRVDWNCMLVASRNPLTDLQSTSSRCEWVTKGIVPSTRFWRKFAVKGPVYAMQPAARRMLPLRLTCDLIGIKICFVRIAQ